MHTTIDRNKSHALVVTQADLTAIATLLSDNYEDFSFSAFCTEGSKFTGKDLAELLSYENPGYRKIISLTVRGGNVLGPGCSVALGTRTGSSYDFSISDEDDKRALKVADELEKRLTECKPIYSVMTHITPTGLLLFSWTVAAVFFTWRHVLTHSGQLPSASNVSIPDLFNFILPIALLAIFMANKLDVVWKWLFPMVWFSIGRQTNEFDRRATIRGWVFGTTLFGVILSIIANLLTPVVQRAIGTP